MSMNLAFKTPKGEYNDFPFQTPTKLSKQVLAEPEVTKKLLLIKEYLEEEDWVEGDMLKVLYKIKCNLQSGYTLVIV